MLFSNLIPLSIIYSVSKFLSILLFLLSLYVFKNLIKGKFIFLFINFLLIIILIPLISSLYSLCIGKINIILVWENSKYMLYFSMIFIFIYLLYFITLSKILYMFSILFIIKLLLTTLLIINMNFGDELFKDYILNDIDLVVHHLFDRYRVFDKYLFLFPLVIFYIKNKSNFLKVFFHIILLFNMVFSMTLGIIFTYIIFMAIYFRRYILYYSLFFLFLVLINIDSIIHFYYKILIEKELSFLIKINQYLFVFDNLTFFGIGLGQIIEIFGRTDTMLENVFLYWLIAHGIIGFLFFFMLFIIFPIFIKLKYSSNLSIHNLFVIHIVILVSSVSNPYLVSFMGILPLSLMISFYFYQLFIQRKKNYV